MAQPSILTVITPAADQNLVSLADVQDELKNTASADVAFLTRAIRQASVSIANYCNRVFLAETVSEEFRGRGAFYAFYGSGQYLASLADGSNAQHAGDPIMLARTPVASVTSVTEDGILLTAGTDYEVDAARGFLRRLFAGLERQWAFNTLVVVYVAGYASGAVPDDLQDAALRLITARYRARGRDPLMKSSEAQGLGRQEYWVGAPPSVKGGFPQEIAAILDSYCEVVTA